MTNEEQIDKIAEHAGMSINQLATELCVSSSALYNIRSGRNELSRELMLKILEKYPTISPAWLLLKKGRFLTTEREKSEIVIDSLKKQIQSLTEINKQITENIKVLTDKT